MNDAIDPTTSPAPGVPSSPAAPPAAFGPADLDQRIDEWRRSEAYAKGDRDAVDAVQQHYRMKNGEGPELTLSDRPAELTVPPGFDLPPIVRDDAAATIREIGLGAQGQAVFEFALGRSGPPNLPADYRPPTPEIALGKLRESEGQFADRVLETARDAVSVLDALRTRAGRPAGELRQFLDRSGAGSDPAVVKFFSRLHGRLASTEPALMAAARRRERR